MVVAGGVLRGIRGGPAAGAASRPVQGRCRSEHAVVSRLPSRVARVKSVCVSRRVPCPAARGPKSGAANPACRSRRTLSARIRVSRFRECARFPFRVAFANRAPPRAVREALAAMAPAAARPRNLMDVVQ